MFRDFARASSVQFGWCAHQSGAVLALSLGRSVDVVEEEEEGEERVVDVWEQAVTHGISRRWTWWGFRLLDLFT